MNFKYLIIEHEGLLVPVLFSTSLRHDDMARFLAKPVVSAGHVKLWSDGDEPTIEVCGRAGTLNIDPVKEDEVLILADYRRLRGKAAAAENERIEQL